MIPRMIRSITLDTKYGKTHNATPAKRAVTLCCFFPYMKYPMPIELKNRAIKSVVVSIVYDSRAMAAASR